MIGKRENINTGIYFVYKYLINQHVTIYRYWWMYHALQTECLQPNQTTTFSKWVDQEKDGTSLNFKQTFSGKELSIIAGF